MAQRIATALHNSERISPAPEPTVEEWESREEALITENFVLGETERMSLVQARRGQGLFRQNVQSVESACRVTGVERQST